MASAFAHALVAYTGTKFNLFNDCSWRILLFSVIWSIAPDIDSVGYFLGIPYGGDLLGHRGISHSLFFAFISSLFLVLIFFPNLDKKIKIYLIIFFTTIMSSHGLLDAMTTGGLGVAFFAPFDNTRYFLPWRPLLVFPLLESNHFLVNGECA